MDTKTIRFSRKDSTQFFKTLNKRVNEYFTESAVMLVLNSGEQLKFETYKTGIDSYRFELFLETQNRKKRLNSVRPFYFNELTLDQLELSSFQCSSDIYVTSNAADWKFQDEFKNFSDQSFLIQFTNKTTYNNLLNNC